MRIRSKELRRTRKRAEDRHKERHPGQDAAKTTTAAASAAPRRK